MTVTWMSHLSLSLSVVRHTHLFDLLSRSGRQRAIASTTNTQTCNATLLPLSPSLSVFSPFSLLSSSLSSSFPLQFRSRNRNKIVQEGPSTKYEWVKLTEFVHENKMANVCESRFRYENIEIRLEGSKFTWSATLKITLGRWNHLDLQNEKESRVCFVVVELEASRSICTQASHKSGSKNRTIHSLFVLGVSSVLFIHPRRLSNKVCYLNHRHSNKTITKKKKNTQLTGLETVCPCHCVSQPRLHHHHSPLAPPAWVVLFWALCLLLSSGCCVVTNSSQSKPSSQMFCHSVHSHPLILF